MPVGKTKKKIPRLTNLLDKYNFNYDIVLTSHRSHAISLTRSFINKGYLRIIAVGGDGTINEVINGVMQSDHTNRTLVGIIPMGGGNDFIKNFNFSSNLEDNVRIIEKGHIEKIDAVKFGNQYFINSLGLGFDALVAKNAGKIRYFNGQIRYLISLIGSIFRLKNFKLRLKTENKIISCQTYLISVSKSKSIGGGFMLTPNARPYNNVIDVCIIKKAKLFRLAEIIFTVLKGDELDYSEVKYLRSREMDIRLATKQPLYYDGEVMKKDVKEVKIELSNQKINLIC